MRKRWDLLYEPENWPLRIPYSQFLMNVLDCHAIYRMGDYRAHVHHNIDRVYYDIFSRLYYKPPSAIANMYKFAIRRSDYYYCFHPHKLKTAEYMTSCIGLVLDALNKVYGKEFRKVITDITTNVDGYDKLIAKYKTLTICNLQPSR